MLIKYIKEKYGFDVIALALDVGQSGMDLPGVKKKALSIGAKKAYAFDGKKEFANSYLSKAIKANALYEGKYPLVSALSRPLISKYAVDVAHKEGASFIAHGCTGKGNDQVRFEVAIASMDPDMQILAPVREWGPSREEEIEYAKKHGIEVPSSNKTYSIDENLWGRSIECGILEKPDEEPPGDVFKLVTPPEKAKDNPEYVTIEFKEGTPTGLNGKKMPLLHLISSLNKMAGKNGVGIIDHMEDRIVGLKSREIYECPAAVCIIEAHRDLEKYVSTIHENQFKQTIDQKWAELAYYGLWADPLMGSIESFINNSNKKVNGKVKLKLYKGGVIVVGRTSKNAIYDLALSTYDKGSTFDQSSSKGFIELWGLQTKVANNLKVKWNGKALGKGP